MPRSLGQHSYFKPPYTSVNRKQRVAPNAVLPMGTCGRHSWSMRGALQTLRPRADERDKAVDAVVGLDGHDAHARRPGRRAHDLLAEVPGGLVRVRLGAALGEEGAGEEAGDEGAARSLVQTANLNSEAQSPTASSRRNAMAQFVNAMPMGMGSTETSRCNSVAQCQ